MLTVEEDKKEEEKRWGGKDVWLRRGENFAPLSVYVRETLSFDTTPI